MTRRMILILVVVFAVVGLAVAAAAQLSGDDDSSNANAPRGRSHDAKAPAAQDSRRRAVVWAVGDGADGGPEAKQVADLIARSRPDRVLYLGDVYESGTPEDFDQHYRPVYDRFARITFPTPGNHDWPNHGAGYDPYWGKANARVPTNRHYYRLKVGGWEILSLNSESGLDRGSPQMRWLRQHVRGRGTCRIAFWHRPFMNAGKHGDQEDVAPLWNTLRGHAALVLSGHDHNLQHFKRKDGIVELISGAGGHDLYQSNENDPRLVWDEDDEYCALRLDLRAGSARFRFVTLGKGTVHKGRVACNPR
jgi:Calcineurin-like phosphoesterase